MYSKWNKIDLHIHTDMSKQTKANDYEGSFSVDTLYEKLKENELDMVSLTDHNIINCSAYSELIEKDIDLLVGVELDVSINAVELKEYIYSLNEQTGEKIKHKPFHALVLFETKEFNILSEKLEKMYLDISEKELENTINLTANKFLRCTTLEYIVKHFSDENFFIIAHGNKEKGIVESCSTGNNICHAQHEILIGSISALEMKSNSKTQSVINKYNDGFKKLLKRDFQIINPTSYVSFSDNHNCNAYNLREYKTWIKGKPTYETLRLAFSDPDSRIHTSNQPPRTNANYIECMNICVNEEQQEVHFSPQLNVIIGGRSSGKSLLFNSIINLNNRFSLEDKKLFRKNYANMVDSEKTVAKLSVGKYEHSISIPGEAFYQESIIKLFEEEDGLKSKLSDEFIDVDDSIIQESELKVDNVVSELLKAYKEYFEIASKIQKGDIRDHIQLSVRKSEKLFGVDMEKIIVKADLKQFRDLLSEIDDYTNETIKIRDKKLYGEDVFTESEKVEFNNLLTLLSIKNIDNTSKLRAEELKIKFKDQVKNILNQYISEELSNERQLIESTKNILNEYMLDYEKYFRSKFNLKVACKKLEELDVKIEDKMLTKSNYKFITKVNLNISGNKIIEDFFKEKIMNYVTQYNLYNNLLFLANSVYVDTRIKQHTDDGKKPDRLSAKLKEYIRSVKSNKTYEIIEVVEDSHEISTLSTSQGKKASIFLDIKLNNMLMSHDYNVLFIDQLEDNIDNKYISKELVSLIREIKKKIQVILVTHNPSIAIYGDAENIIIAENIANSFSYRQGGLEDSEIREEACRILDGGEVAFKNRMDKYNIDVLFGDGE
ncbi:MAG: hypothetical protein WBA54_00585 [Acidaminobacteraceae bacterium]